MDEKLKLAIANLDRDIATIPYWLAHDLVLVCKAARKYAKTIRSARSRGWVQS